MKFAILLEVNGRQRVDTSTFETADDARNHIRTTHAGYVPKSSEQAMAQMESNPHYVEVWHNLVTNHQDVVVVKVDSDDNLVDSVS